MPTNTIARILLHALFAALFFFVLNFYILKTEFQSAVFWAVSLGVIAGGLAWQQTRRPGG